jgi:lysophospholipase L1-like esterase
MRTKAWRRWLAGALAVGVLAACGGDDSPAAPADPSIVLVALGDSFSSGEGAAPYDATPKTCHRSDLGWARRLDADATRVVSLDLNACSGAKTENLTAPWTSRHLPAQIPTTANPDVTLVLFTIGGNDVGFGDIVATCFIVSCADVPASPGFLGVVHALTDALRTSVYPALERAYPKASLVHVGYPRLTPAPGQPVDGCAWLSPDEQVATAQILDAVNAAIRAAADASQAVTYLDTTEALAGHELCSGSSWLQPVRIGGDSQAHPTAEGQRALERAIAAARHIPLS